MQQRASARSKKKKPATKGKAKAASTPRPTPYPADGLTKAQMAKQEARWRAESDLRTLQEAESIKGDPGRMRMMKVLADEQMKALQKIKKV